LVAQCVEQLNFIMAQLDNVVQNLVLVMGLTGAGKSYFVNKLSGKNLQEGHTLASCKSFT
jgi:predicted GTPase